MGRYGRPGESAGLSLASELTNQVNCLSPGYTLTDMNSTLRDNKQARQTTEEMIMLKRVGQPEEQAGAVLYFLSDFATCAYMLGPPRELQAETRRYDWD
jgi:NAD(P)-dependent dehydrogenase (short-subunit alcohol dehydrogenase family)